MKTLKCDLCDFKTQGETFEDWMENLKSHYVESHMDVMKENMDKSNEEKMAGMKKWMEENKARFEAKEEDR